MERREVESGEFNVQMFQGPYHRDQRSHQAVICSTWGQVLPLLPADGVVKVRALLFSDATAIAIAENVDFFKDARADG